MKKILTILFFMVFVLLISGCKEKSEKEQFIDFLKDEGYTCNKKEECTKSEYIDMFGVESHTFDISSEINFVDKVIIQEEILHKFDSEDKEAIFLFQNDLESGEITIDITIKINDEIILQADYENNQFSIGDTTLTDEEVEEIKQETLEHKQSIVNKWNKFFDDANIDQEDLY